ncbi:MAG: phosphoribosylanthranilate isomerase [Desulfosarcina sp.]|nr:phosphoribosylanthranilate isomerase [Desulfobacterales bacterium]
MSDKVLDANHPQIKICGLTRPQEAEACAAAGADAIGYIFYPPSPRCIPAEQAGRITRVLPDTVCPVGIFVNATYDAIMQTVEIAGLRAVQLHGRETPVLVERLRTNGLTVIKALFYKGTPGFNAIARYSASAYLVECVGGPLPGGTALSWNWCEARPLSNDFPVVLAGGLSPENIAAAIREAEPDAVDVSSGIEIQPGRKDLSKVRALCRVVSQVGLNRPLRNIFRKDRFRRPF